jgi:hypothetical protein
MPPLDKDGKPDQNTALIKLRLDIRILPMDQAEANKVGEQRQEPNNSPELPKPVGRMSFSLNPFNMLAQLVGPHMMRKVMFMACMCACCALVLMMLPFIASNIASTLIMKFLGLN